MIKTEEEKREEIENLRKIIDRCEAAIYGINFPTWPEPDFAPFTHDKENHSMLEQVSCEYARGWANGLPYCKPHREVIDHIDLAESAKVS